MLCNLCARHGPVGNLESSTDCNSAGTVAGKIGSLCAHFKAKSEAKWFRVQKGPFGPIFFEQFGLASNTLLAAICKSFPQQNMFINSGLGASET